MACPRAIGMLPRLGVDMVAMSPSRCSAMRGLRMRRLHQGCDRIVGCGAGGVLPGLLLSIASVLWLVTAVRAETPGTFRPTGSMTTARMGHTATLLPNGQVLVAGGASLHQTTESSAELYT